MLFNMILEQFHTTNVPYSWTKEGTKSKTEREEEEKDINYKHMKLSKS